MLAQPGLHPHHEAPAPIAPGEAGTPVYHPATPELGQAAVAGTLPIIEQSLASIRRSADETAAITRQIMQTVAQVRQKLPPDSSETSPQRPAAPSQMTSPRGNTPQPHPAHRPGSQASSANAHYSRRPDPGRPSRPHQPQHAPAPQWQGNGYNAHAGQAHASQQGHQERVPKWPVQLDEAQVVQNGSANVDGRSQRDVRPSQHATVAPQPQNQPPRVERSPRATHELTPIVPAKRIRRERVLFGSRRRERTNEHLNRVLQPGAPQEAQRQSQQKPHAPMNKRVAHHTRNFADRIHAVANWMENPQRPAWLRFPDLHNARYRMRNAYDNLSVRVYDATEAAAVRASRIWNVNLLGARSWASSYLPGENVLHGNFGLARQARRAQRNIDREANARAADRFDMRVAMRDGLMDVIQQGSWRVVEPGNNQDTLAGTPFRAMASDIVNVLSRDDHYRGTIANARRVYHDRPLEAAIAHTLANQVFVGRVTPDEYAEAVRRMSPADRQHFVHAIGDAVSDTVIRLNGGIRHLERANRRAAKAQQRVR